MPLSPVQVQAVIKSTIGHLGRDDTQSNLAIRDKIADRLGIAPGPDRVAVFNYVRQGRRMYESGEAAEQQNPNLPVVPTSRDPTIGQGITSYRYRTIVVVDPGDGSAPQRHLVVVDSAIPLTPREIGDEAVAEHNTNTPDYPGRVLPAVAPPGGTLRVEILTTGRK